MATALQQQLAAIAANSTHQLDLRAQKARHSKSLLFESRDAASQSFDTIYQICYEGFEELCMLDPRFSAFARSIFGEQSQYEDRTQMTAKENEELDKILESFLGLVCGRLLLKPAMKAVEWLVRRFRVPEYNTECVLLTFLPYHSSHIFPTLLSILPDVLPPSFKFLHPSVASLQCPPRHAILSAAISNPAFFSAFNRYVLRAAKARHHSAVLIGFWASITAQAVNGMIDTTRSGRESIRKQREEDLLLRILPVLQAALTIKDIPELYLGACMILTILATKASLEEEILDAMMEAVVGAWTEETLEEGLTCLAVIAEEKQQLSQPSSVTRALLKAESSIPRIVQLSQAQRVSKLASATSIGIITSAVRRGDATSLPLVRRLIEAAVLHESHALVVLKRLLTGLVDIDKDDGGDVFKGISGILTKLSDHADGARRLKLAAQNAKVDLRTLDILPAPVEDDGVAQSASVDGMDIELDPREAQSEFNTILQSLPDRSSKDTSFLGPSSDATEAQQYIDTFQTSLKSRQNMEKLLDWPQLHRSKSLERPDFFSFLVRIWMSNAALIVKVRALEVARTQLQSFGEQGCLDTQALLPYVVTALADANSKVRKAAADLCRTMHNLYGSEVGKSLQPCPETNIYGGAASSPHFLLSDDAHRLLSSAILPILEDGILDRSYLVRALADILNNGSLSNDSKSATNHKELKKTLRSDACSFLASHMALTPMLRVKQILLQILNRAGKSAAHTRSKTILPFVKEWLHRPVEDVTSICAAEGIDVLEMDRVIIHSHTHRTTEEIRLLEDIAAGRNVARVELVALALERLQHLFPLMKASQVELVELLLDLALQDSAPDNTQDLGDMALETLRALPLPKEVAVHLLESLPSVGDLQDQPPSAKKQRTSRTDTSRLHDVDQNILQSAIRRITLGLELVEASKPEKHPQLLRGLFHLLSELHHYKSATGSELVYLQQLLLSCLLAVVDGLKSAAAEDVDRSVIRTDLIVECVRTTSSSQIHNTALLLVSSLASWAPELVLHSVMPLFTFMSSTLLRQSDDYSAHVTDQTVARIVPPLAASLKKKGKSLASGAADLLLSFTAAFEHIPLHRRAGLFGHLVDTLGPDETLFAMTAMLLERYPSDPRLPAFVADLLNRFEPATGIQSARQYLDLIFDALKPKRGLSETLLGLADKTEDEIEHSIDNLLTGLATLLQNSTLRQRLAVDLSSEDKTAQQIRRVYASLLEQAMQLTRDLASDSNLKDVANALLSSVLGLMPTKDFIDSSGQLMQTGSDETRQQVFHSLEARVSTLRTGDVAAAKVFIDVLPNCAVFIREDQPIGTRHAAISCIDQISERYGKIDRAAVLEAAEVVAGNAAFGSSHVSLRTMSVLCLASMIEVLGNESIPVLPAVLTRTLEYLAIDMQAGRPNYSFQNAAFGLLNAVLDRLPWMLSARNLDQALKLADYFTALSEVDENANEPVQDFCSLVAKKIGAAELFATMERTWADVLSLGAGAMHRHLTILHQAIQHHTKATITRNTQNLFTVLLEAFDLHRRFVDVDDSDLGDDDDIYNLVDRVALDTTLKLNDATFRPFFIRLVEWATVSLPKRETDGRILRTISLFSFSLTLFEQLKSIVTSYASFLLEVAAQQLHRPFSLKATDRQVLDFTLQTLSSSFRHDQDDFWQAPAHFDAIAVPLMSQLKNAKSASSFITDRVIPAITDLAAAAASPEHHKAMNTTIMSYMRSEDAAVRLAAVKCERSITERINFDWLALLPEMLPFISELQEDDNEGVERETLRWVKQIEDVTGESLEGMLA